MTLADNGSDYFGSGTKQNWEIIMNALQLLYSGLHILLGVLHLHSFFQAVILSHPIKKKHIRFIRFYKICELFGENHITHHSSHCTDFFSYWGKICCSTAEQQAENECQIPSKSTTAAKSKQVLLATAAFLFFIFFKSVLRFIVEFSQGKILTLLQYSFVELLVWKGELSCRAYLIFHPLTS